MKRRMPSDPEKLAARRADLKRAGEWKRARERELFGSQGAAGKVRHIDPVSDEGRAIALAYQIDHSK